MYIYIHIYIYVCVCLCVCVCVLLKILGTIAVTSTERERLGSVLKRLNKER